MSPRSLKLTLHIAIVAVLAGGTASVVWAGDPVKLAQALRAPIVEGQSLAGVRLGSSELDVVGLLGVPDQTSSASTEAKVQIKAADYLILPAAMLRVFFRDGRVDAVSMIAFDQSRPPRLAPTARGVGLFSDLRAVRAAFGPGTGGRLWYPDLGIAFNPADRDRPDEESVYVILVVRPGTNDLIEVYGRVVH